MRMIFWPKCICILIHLFVFKERFHFHTKTLDCQGPFVGLLSPLVSSLFKLVLYDQQR